MAEARRLASFKAACSYGGFGKTKAYELIDAGKIAAYKMDRHTMVDLDTIDRYRNALPKWGHSQPKRKAKRKA